MPEQRRCPALLLFGSPGTGKGTQGRILGQLPGFYHSASGDIFRALDPNSADGQEFRYYASRGELVPDDLTIRIWQNALAEAIESGRYNPQSEVLILDGIPRNAHQAEIMKGYIDVLKIVHLVYADEEVIVERMKLRAIKEGRKDDADEATIRHRFGVYRRETTPMLDVYPKGTVAEIDSLNKPIKVLRNIVNAVIPALDEHFGDN